MKIIIKALKISIFSSISWMLSGCVMLSSTPVSVNILSKIDKKEKVVTFLNNTPYVADMSIALAKNGFEVKPILAQQQITELQNPHQIKKYNEAAARWGISLQTQHSGMKCAFTDFDIHHFTLILTDITNNKVILVLKQKGSDGPCTTVEPVFGTLAQSLAENW